MKKLTIYINFKKVQFREKGKIKSALVNNLHLRVIKENNQLEFGLRSAITRRWSERSRRAFTDLRTGGDVKEGGGGGGGEKLQLPFSAHSGVLFTGGHVSLISLFRSMNG